MIPFQNYIFHASRLLPKTLFPYAEAVHGHRFQVQLRALGSSASAKKGSLAACQKLLMPLQLSYLNDALSLPTPTDIEILMYLSQRLPDQEWDSLSIQSLDNIRWEWFRPGQLRAHNTFELHSAHFLPNVHKDHKCGRMHGHNFGVSVSWQADLLQWSQTYQELLPILEALQARLHQRCLNEIPGLENPTSENLASWIFQRLKAQFIPILAVTVQETKSAGCRYNGQDYRIYKDFEVDSALRAEVVLGAKQVGEIPFMMLGHSYLLRLFLQSSLDSKYGWCLDFADIKERFQPLFKQLDHQFLDEVLAHRFPSLEDILSWLAPHLRVVLPQLVAMTLWETEYSGLEYSLT